MLKRPRRQVLGLGSLVLLASVAIVLSGGSLSAVAVLIGLSLPPAFVIPVIWRIMTGRELLSDIEDFQQERLVPLMKELESRGIEATLLELPSDAKGEFEPLAPFKTFENLAQMRLTSHEVDFVHIGYWIDSKSGTEAFYLDFALECEIEDESRISTELSMVKRLVLFGWTQSNFLPSWRLPGKLLITSSRLLSHGLVLKKSELIAAHAGDPLPGPGLAGLPGGCQPMPRRGMKVSRPSWLSVKAI
jgi:hypothetical protein